MNHPRHASRRLGALIALGCAVAVLSPVAQGAASTPEPRQALPPLRPPPADWPAPPPRRTRTRSPGVAGASTRATRTSPGRRTSRSTGTRRALLAKIALPPKAKWFGKWIPNAEISRKVDSTSPTPPAATPTSLVQMTVFRMVPWEHEACRRLPTRAERASYRQWTDRFAAAASATPTWR